MKNFLIYFLGIICLAGCYFQQIYVYEKIPEKIECYRFKEYNDVKSCNRKHQIILNEKLYKVINTTNHRNN